MKLLEITFKTAPRIPGVRQADLSQVRLKDPGSQLLGWKVLIRGASLFFVSPADWKAPGRENKGLSTIHEVPRLNCFLYWEGDVDDIANVTKYDSPPFGPEPVVKSSPETKPPKKTEDVRAPLSDEKVKAAVGGLLAQVPGILP